MQYTYLPRLALVDASTAGAALPPRTTFSVTRRSAPRPFREATARDSRLAAAWRPCGAFGHAFSVRGGTADVSATIVARVAQQLDDALEARPDLYVDELEALSTF
jgi:hypothetical protein